MKGPRYHRINAKCVSESSPGKLGWMLHRPQEVTDRRAELASQHFRLAGADEGRLAQHKSEALFSMGRGFTGFASKRRRAGRSCSGETAMVLPAAQLKQSPEIFFNGLASIYVLPRRYDYNEFAKMVEGRSVPPNWQSHWKFDGIQSYVAVVASDSRRRHGYRLSRLASPIASLAVASRSITVPRWFAEGLGRVRRFIGSKERPVGTRANSIGTDCRDWKHEIRQRLHQRKVATGAFRLNRDGGMPVVH